MTSELDPLDLLKTVPNSSESTPLRETFHLLYRMDLKGLDRMTEEEKFAAVLVCADKPSREDLFSFRNNPRVRMRFQGDGVHVYYRGGRAGVVIRTANNQDRLAVDGKLISNRWLLVEDRITEKKRSGRSRWTPAHHRSDPGRLS